MLHREIVAENQPVFLLRHQIAPPYPWRDTCQTRKFQNAIGRTTGIMTIDMYLPVVYRDAETVVRTLPLRNDNRRFLGSHRNKSRHLSHIVLPHLEGRCHYRISIRG